VIVKNVLASLRQHCS